MKKNKKHKKKKTNVNNYKKDSVGLFTNFKKQVFADKKDKLKKQKIDLKDLEE